MLGYSSKEELLSKRVSEVFADESQRASIVREVRPAKPVPTATNSPCAAKTGSLSIV